MAKSSTVRQPKDVTINIRAAESQRDLIDQAAEMSGMSRTEFILDVACREAQDRLLDNPKIVVDQVTFDWLLQRLDGPPDPNENLKRSMATPPPWK